MNKPIRKVRAGQPMGRDAIKLQSALLEPRTAMKQTVPQIIMGSIWKWL